MCQSAQSFFGLQNKEYIYEEIFSLLEHCHGISWEAAWSMPVMVRRWWILRKNKDIEENAKNQQNAERSSTRR